MSVLLSRIAFVLGMLELLLVFCAMYWGKQTQGLLLLAFLVSVMLVMLLWQACAATRRCCEQVKIMPAAELVTLYGPTGKAVRTFRFADIKTVQVVRLSTVAHVGRASQVHRHPYICISTVAADSHYVDVRENPNCIVFAYDEDAYQLLQTICAERLKS